MSKSPLIPVVTAQEMARIEQQAISRGASEEKFMAEAGRKVALAALEWIERAHLPKRVALLVGKGNNGGDAYAAGLHLLDAGVHVRALTCYPSGQCSPLNRLFGEWFQKQRGAIHPLNAQVQLTPGELLIDGLLGTGFHGSPESNLAVAIDWANRSGNPILAIDLPSGLDGTSGETRGAVILAGATVTLGFPKIGLFLRQGWNCVGRLQVADFGLPHDAIPEATSYIPSQLSLPPMTRCRHKYQAGYVVGLGGSSLFRGAPKLAGLAALRMGAGIVRVFHRGEIGEAPFELICQPWTAKAWKDELKRASAVFLGPGLGHTRDIRRRLCTPISLPTVIDADALQADLEYPKEAILTPHRGEVLRLLGLQKAPPEEELLAKCQTWARRHKRVLLLKGAPTFIFSSTQAPVIIPHGDPGMATAGTGDVLTGMLAALLAQKMGCLEAAILGATLHAEAGEFAAAEKSSYGMIASDLLMQLPLVLRKYAGQARTNLSPL